MAIKYNNILSLIGNGRYHSCILTTYSFDFYFFEMKVMKWFRSCGIKNVNVFIDGYFYSELMQQMTGEEMSLSTGYSLYPVFEKNIFHPKIWLLFGENEGLLLVGSGNLTNSGNGSNDEIWGAYHFDIKQPHNALIFSAAWQYISQITEKTKGIISEKTTNWIVKHSQWLTELPQITEFQFANLPNNENVALLYNSSHSTIWQQVLQLIGNDKITEIIAVSPYYDIKGKALEVIKEAFPKAQVSVILEESGIIPSSLLNDNNYLFYDWKDLKVSRDIGADQHSRLHAKILHFKTSKNIEYCLFGSANVTSAGLGISKNANAEVSLFLKSANGGILDKIGLKILTKNKKALSQFVVFNKCDIEQIIIKNNQYPIKLIAAEINYSGLTIYTNRAIDMPISIAIYDNDNLVEIFNTEHLREHHEITLNVDTSLFRYVQILSIDGNNKLSNKVIVSNFFSIAKTHPNPQNVDIERLCGQLQNGELRNVLDLIHYATIDESEKEDGDSFIYTSKKKFDIKDEKVTADQTRLYELSDYKPTDTILQQNESAFLLSPSLRILDAIKLAHSRILGLETDIRIDEQEEDISGISGNDESEVKQRITISLRIIEADKRKLLKYFDNIYNYFHHKILFKNTKVPDYKPTITDLTKYLIALELIHEFGGKSEKIEEQQKQHYFPYLPITGNYENNNVKGCCLNIVGDFLRLVKNGFKEYSFDYTKKKFVHLRHDALISTITCIINTQWDDDELIYLKILLLNSLHYLGWTTSEELDENLEILITEVKTKLSQLKQPTRNFKAQLDFFSDSICNAYKHSIQKRERGSFANKAERGQIIYSSVAGVGYCYVVYSTKQNEYCLARPGFDWNSKENEYINHFNDAVYRPLPLKKMIIIDL